MHFTTIAGRRYAQFERLRHEPGLVHAFATRPTDVALRPEEGEAEEARAARRRQMAIDLDLDATRLSCCNQVHETRIAVLDTPPARGVLEACDAVVTSHAGNPLMTFSADCPLVLAYDPRRRVLGLAHASWRCTVAGLCRTLVEAMQQRLNVTASDLICGIGPGAGVCCYEVQADVHRAARGLPDFEQFFQHRDGRLYFDLWRANQALLVAAGVRADNIEISGVCTMCRTDVFYSYRREGVGCGHFGLMASLV